MKEIIRKQLELARKYHKENKKQTKKICSWLGIGIRDLYDLYSFGMDNFYTKNFHVSLEIMQFDYHFFVQTHNGEYLDIKDKKIKTMHGSYFFILGVDSLDILKKELIDNYFG